MQGEVHPAGVLGERYSHMRLHVLCSYGRRVAAVPVKGLDLGENLSRAGFAIPQPEFLKTDPARAKQYTEAFAAAKRSKAGAFAGQWIEPVRWRRGDRLACER